MTTASVSFTYNLERDEDLHRWLVSIEHDRSRAIREMLRRGLEQSDNSLLEQILEEIRAIRGNGHTSAIEKSDTTPANVASETAMRNLRDLGK